MSDETPASTTAWPPGAGEMARRIRAYDWASTPLGPSAGWPQSLQTAVDLALQMRRPVSLAWGPEARLLYNHEYIAILGDKHPAALGQPFAQVWPELID